MPSKKIKENLLKSLNTKFSNNDTNQLLILSNPLLAEEIFTEIHKADLLRPALLLPHPETLPYDFFSPPSKVRSQRIETLAKLLTAKNTILVASVQSLMCPCSDIKHLSYINQLKVGAFLIRSEFLKSLENDGYSNKEVVLKSGEYSLRGSIIDVFFSNFRNPLRIEIYDKKIESLRFFNSKTQLTSKKVDIATTLPAFEYPLNEKGVLKFKKNWRNYFDAFEGDSEIFQKIILKKSANGAEMYLPLFFSRKNFPFSFLKNFNNVLVDPNIYKEAKKYEDLIAERYGEFKYDKQRPLLKPSELFLGLKELKQHLSSFKVSKVKYKLPLKDSTSFLLRNEKAETYDNLESNSVNLPLVGDKVVHLKHGIGIYRGLTQIEANQVINDCLEIEYLNKSKVFVPINSTKLVTKYFGPEDTPIDRLGSNKWTKRKNKALKKTFDVAVELLNIQTNRKLTEGTKYKIPKEYYKSFVSRFPYQETIDQFKTIEEVENDLKSPTPMDRLICGEVGFGKTEIAMRASFVAAYNNKQTCLLVPTTLLAQQHSDSFKKRFSQEAVSISCLTRNTKPNERKITISNLSQGKIDILIGTHAVLQDSIKFKDLGLLIIDEEHRFGVRQKEKLKKIKGDINVLNLTATPIPRSLNFALSKIKDFSIIASPPPERLSVKTFVYKLSKHLIREGIQREKLRGGQAYYLCNDLRLINDRKKRLEEQFPDLTIGLVHGKLRASTIERTMVDFQQGEVDILVCSTIIESGLDIANANTLIVEESDKLGLAQLHQLRGRIGRGKRQAYAYFLKSNYELKKKAAKSRLDALLESDSLAAGFLLAIKDLEIRGAGEILGENQSGIFESIGLDLYSRLLKRAVEFIEQGIIDFNYLQNTTEINLGISSYIPQNFLPDVNLRLLMYNKISMSNSLKEINLLKSEMKDRFGSFPVQVTNLFTLNELRILAEKASIKSINVNTQNITFTLEKTDYVRTINKPKNINTCVKRVKQEIRKINNNQ